MCRAQFGFDKAIFASTLEEWAEIITRNPFRTAATKAPTTVHVALLETDPEPLNVERVRSFAVQGEQFEVVQNVAYLHTPQGFGKSKMAASFDKWIGVTNTARKWNTVLKLAVLGHAAA